MGRGKKSLLCDPGSELRLGGRENRRAKIINGMKKKTKNDYFISKAGKQPSRGFIIVPPLASI